HRGARAAGHGLAAGEQVGGPLGGGQPVLGDGDRGQVPAAVGAVGQRGPGGVAGHRAQRLGPGRHLADGLVDEGGVDSAPHRADMLYEVPGRSAVGQGQEPEPVDQPVGGDAAGRHAARLSAPSPSVKRSGKMPWARSTRPSGGGSRRTPGRSSRRRTVAATTTLAGWTPRPAWWPWPKNRWWCAGRSRRNRSGSGTASASNMADAGAASTNVPAGMRVARGVPAASTWSRSQIRGSSLKNGLNRSASQTY